MEPETPIGWSKYQLLCAIGAAVGEISQTDVETATPSVFHACGPSGITIPGYVMHLAHYMNCSPECFVVAIILLDRLLISSASSSAPISMGPRTAHRLILTALVVAIKSLDDHYYRNTFYARVGGVSTAELNRMEVAFLAALRYDLHVAAEEFEATTAQLRAYHTNACLAQTVPPAFPVDSVGALMPSGAEVLGGPCQSVGSADPYGTPPAPQHVDALLGADGSDRTPCSTDGSPCGSSGSPCGVYALDSEGCEDEYSDLGSSDLGAGTQAASLTGGDYPQPPPAALAGHTAG